MSKANKKPRVVASPSVNLVVSSKGDESAPGEAPPPAFRVALDGVPIGATVELAFWETKGADDGDGSANKDRELGRIKGKTSTMRGPHGWCGFEPEGALPTQQQATGKKTEPILVSFELWTPAGPQKAFFFLEDKDAHTKEGDAWELQVRGKCSIGGADRPLAGLPGVALAPACPSGQGHPPTARWQPHQVLQRRLRRSDRLHRRFRGHDRGHRAGPALHLRRRLVVSPLVSTVEGGDVRRGKPGEK